MSLTETTVRNAKSRERPYKLSDEKGLYVQVNPNGSKLWHLKYRFADKEKRLAFGPYPTVTLVMAREQQTEAQRLLRNKVDPGENKKQAKRAAKVATANSFEAVAREWFAKFSSKWAESHSCKVLLRLDNDLIPWMGSRPISSIEADELLATIRRVENRGALDSAHRCLGTSSQIFRYAIATSRAKRNPASDLRGALPPVPDDNHFPSITDPDKVGELLRATMGRPQITREHRSVRCGRWHGVCSVWSFARYTATRLRIFVITTGNSLPGPAQVRTMRADQPGFPADGGGIHAT